MLSCAIIVLWVVLLTASRAVMQNLCLLILTPIKKWKIRLKSGFLIVCHIWYMTKILGQTKKESMTLSMGWREYYICYLNHWMQIKIITIRDYPNRVITLRNATKLLFPLSQPIRPIVKNSLTRGQVPATFCIQTNITAAYICNFLKILHLLCNNDA